MVGDGCSFLARERGCRTIIDAATLTGTTGFTAKQVRRAPFYIVPAPLLSLSQLLVHTRRLLLRLCIPNACYFTALEASRSSTTCVEPPLIRCPHEALGGDVFRCTARTARR